MPNVFMIDVVDPTCTYNFRAFFYHKIAFYLIVEVIYKVIFF